jgi:hypothetical protein
MKTNLLDGLVSFMARASIVFIALPCAAHAGGVVSVLDEAHFRSAMNGGGTVTFAADGSVYLTQTNVVMADTTIDAAGHNVVLDGQNQTRILDVNSNINLTIKGIVLRNAKVQGQTYTGSDDSVTKALGAAIRCSGNLYLFNCVLESNTVAGGSFHPVAPTGSSGSLAAGPAVYCDAGSLTASNCTFRYNSGSTTNQGMAAGGAVFVANTTAAFDRVRFISNSIVSSYPTPGGQFANTGPGTALGGSVYSSSSTVALRNCEMLFNSVTGCAPLDTTSGTALPGQGGAIFVDSGTVSVTNSFIGNNIATGGPGPNRGIGGNGYGGGIYNKGTVVLANSTLSLNIAVGGAAHTGGDAFGGGIYCAGGRIDLLSSTVFTNAIKTGGGVATAGSGAGGNLNIATNAVVNVTGTLIAQGGIIANGPSMQPPTNPNCAGTLNDLGSNLQWPGTECGPSIPSVDPLLSLPAYNGGFTQTAAIASNSPAIAANTNSCFPTDQRGVARPAASPCDIGAFQNSITMRAALVNQGVSLQITGLPGATCTIETALDLTNPTWQPISTNTLAIDGTSSFTDTTNNPTPQRFYRLLTQ